MEVLAWCISWHRKRAGGMPRTPQHGQHEPTKPRSPWPAPPPTRQSTAATKPWIKFHSGSASLNSRHLALKSSITSFSGPASSSILNNLLRCNSAN